MGTVIECRSVSDSIKEKAAQTVAELKEFGLYTTLGIIRVGERPEDISYEKSIKKSCNAMGIEVRVYELPANISQKDLNSEICNISSNDHIHGIMLFRPLPSHLDEEQARRCMNPKKDIDCITPDNLYKLFNGSPGVQPPCTPAAVIEILKHQGIEISGKQVVVIGRSMVVGKPLGMLFLQENATVTICHSKSRDMEKIIQRGEIVVAALGKAKAINASHISEGAIVIEVGINSDREGQLCGDVDFEDVLVKAGGITPVPGGVGLVTTAILLKHTARAAMELSGKIITSRQ